LRLCLKPLPKSLKHSLGLVKNDEMVSISGKGNRHPPGAAERLEDQEIPAPINQTADEVDVVRLRLYLVVDFRDVRISGVLLFAGVRHTGGQQDRASRRVANGSDSGAPGPTFTTRRWGHGDDAFRPPILP
jgi:hypothetical protein